MLTPRNRALLLETLRPPEGYRFDRAIGTSFSLDLLALLTTPLAFTFFDWEDVEGRPTSDPVALLESVRRHAGRIHLFCQAGEIKLPPPTQSLVAYLEKSVIPVLLPADSKGVRGTFHPKVWVVRYVAEEKAPRYRLICASRNLTFDRSWDTIVSLEGSVVDRTRAIGTSRPLGEFINALPKLSVRPVDEAVRQAIGAMADELVRVRFEPGEHVEGIEFWPLGLDQRKRDPFKDSVSGRPLLVMSPFLSDRFLEQLTQGRPKCVLVSRPEELATVRSDVLERFEGGVYALCGSAEDPEEDRDSEERSMLAGLHAKVYVEDDGWNARVLLGSANATNSGFGRNVEFLVGIKGKRKHFGIDALLGNEGSKEGMRPLLEPWQPDSQDISREEAIAQEIDNELGRIRCRIAEMPLFLDCVAIDEEPGRFWLNLEHEGSAPLDELGNWSCWLMTQPESMAVTPKASDGTLARFGPIGLAALSGFLACRIAISCEGVRRESRFVLNLGTKGMPDDRLERLLVSQISDRDRLIKLLLMLLQPPESVDNLVEAMSGPEAWHEAVQRPNGEAALFESLIRATLSGREQLLEVGRLLQELTRTDEGRALVPTSILDLWAEVKRAAELPK